MPDLEGGNPPCQAKKPSVKGEGDGHWAPLTQGLIPEERGYPPVRQRALPVHGMPEREGGISRSQRAEEEEGESPEQRALPAHDMHARGGTLLPTNNQRGPPEQHAPQAHGVQRGGGGIGAGPQPEGEGGAPPDQPRTPLCAV